MILTFRRALAPRTLVYKIPYYHHPVPKGLVAQLVDRHTGFVEVVGLIPTQVLFCFFREEFQYLYTSVIGSD